MTNRLLSALACAAALLASAGSVWAHKPPDDPTPVQDMGTPQIGPGEFPVEGLAPVFVPQLDRNGMVVGGVFLPWGFADDQPVQRPKVGLAVRRHLAACALFGVHPLLAGLPVEALLTTPADHPKCGGTCCPCGSDCPLSGLIRFWPRFIYLFSVKCEQRCPNATVVFRSCGEEEETAPMPAVQAKEPPSQCPYRCQQAADKHAVQMSDAGLTRDVLSNLKSLLKADELYVKGQNLLEEGQVCEALECFEKVRQLCPGSRYEEMVNRAIAGLDTGSRSSADKDCKKQTVLPLPIYSERPEDGGLFIATPFTMLKVAAARSCEETPQEGQEDPVPATPAGGEAKKQPSLKARLQHSVTLDMRDASLRQVVEQICYCHGIQISLDVDLQQSPCANLDAPITIRLEGVTCKSALKLLLATSRLTFVVQGDKLVVTTKKKAKANNAAGVAGCKPGVAEQVRFLMKACRDAMECGRHQKAADLARQAYALDPELVQADPLVYKMHLLADQHPCGKTSPGGHGGCGGYPVECEEAPPATPAKPVSRGCGTGCKKAVSKCDCCEDCQKNACKCATEGCKVKKGDCSGCKGCCEEKDCCQDKPTACPSCKPKPSTRKQTLLTPCLPAVDPKVVKTLEQVAQEAEDQELTVVVEEEQEAASQPMNQAWDNLGRLLPEKMWAEFNLDRGDLRLWWQMGLGKSTYQIRYEEGNLEITILPVDEITWWEF